MTRREKDRLSNLLRKGKVKQVLDELKRISLSSEERNEAIAISSQYELFSKDKRYGVLENDVKRRGENQIILRVIEFLDHVEINDNGTEVKHSEEGFSKSKKNSRRDTFKWIGFVGSIASIIGLGLYFLPKTEKVLQLTVFVVDDKGNVAIENEGRLNIPLGNRSLNAPIGADGRTNFGDIPSNLVGDSITIGIDAEDWRVKNGANRFLFIDEPIQLVVENTFSTNILKGSVVEKETGLPIDNALLSINNDTTITSDENGAFRILLPTPEDEMYQIRVYKKGYYPANHNYSETDGNIIELVKMEIQKKPVVPKIARMSGRVLDETSRAFLENVLVSLGSNKTKTDEDGFFELRIENPPKVGGVKLIFSKAGYKTENHRYYEIPKSNISESLSKNN